MLDLSAVTSDKPIVVISDTHFGEPFATLGAGTPNETQRAAASATLDHLINSLRRLGSLAEIVLLGDIWEMWSASFLHARRDAAPFLEQICSLPADRITYVPGNHDYHLLVQHIECEQIAHLRHGTLPPPRYRAQHVFTDSFLAGLLPPSAQHRFVVKYPDHSCLVGGRHVLFHHGHHLATLRGGDLFAAFPMFILKRLEGVGLPSLTREELERGVSIFYEMMYALSLGDRTSNRLQAWWTRWEMWKRWWLWSVLGRIHGRLRRVSSVRERGTPQVDIEHFRQAARWLLRLMAGDPASNFTPPDILVFGHTHRSGIATVPFDDETHRLHLVNSGCWLVEPSKRNTDHVNTLAILDNTHVGVYKLSQGGLERREVIQFTPQEQTVVWQ